MVVSECVIVAALAMVAWHMVASPPGPPASGAQIAVPTAQAREPVNNGPIVVRSAPPPINALLPGLNLDSGFWKVRLAEQPSEALVGHSSAWASPSMRRDDMKGK